MKNLMMILFGLHLTSCATIEIYQIDRHSIMEDEASGEWPALDKKFFKTSQAKGAQFFPKEENSKRKQKVFTVLNGEFVDKSK